MQSDDLINMNLIRKNIEKAVVSVGMGRASTQPNFKEKFLPEVLQELALITGQKAAPRQAKKAVASFKTRVGDIIGLQVTLRGKRMEDFLTRLVNIVFPRVKDFRGLELKNVDQSGSLNVGFREQYVFPEIHPERSKVHFGIQVTLVPLTRNRDKAIDIYYSLGVPLKGLKPKPRKK